MLAMDDYRKNSSSLIEYIWEGGRAEGLAEAKAEGFAEGFAEAKAEGKMEEKITIVRTMHALNYTISQISDVTKLSESEIRKILIV